MSGRPLAAMVGAGALALSASGGIEAKPLDPRLPDWRQSQLVEGNSALRGLYFFAVCSVIKKRPAAQALVNSPFGSEQQEQTIASLTAGEDNECLLTAEKMTIRSRSVLRGAVAEALYNQGKMRPRAERPIATSDSFDSFLARSAAARSGRDASQASDELVGRWVAMCAAHRAPGRVHAVVRFNPSSLGEYRVLESLAPDFLSCLPEGRSLRISRLAARASLAEALYGLARTHRDMFENA